MPFLARSNTVGKAVDHDVASGINAQLPGTTPLRDGRIRDVQRQVVGALRIAAIDHIVTLGRLAISLPGLRTHRIAPECDAVRAQHRLAAEQQHFAPALVYHDPVYTDDAAAV